MAKKTGDTWTCQFKMKIPGGDGFTIQVLPEGASSGTRFALKAKAKGSDGQPKTVDLQPIDQQQTQGGSLKASDLASGTTEAGIEIAGAIDGKPVNCTHAAAVTNPPPPADDTPADPLVDTRAKEWLNGPEGRAQYQAFLAERDGGKGRFPKHTVFLVYLPSGADAGANPESATEDDYLQVLAVQRADTPLLTLSLPSCPKRSAFRVLGSSEDFKKVSEELVKRQGLPKEFVLVPVGSQFRCGPDEAVIRLQPQGATAAAADIHLRIRPIYQVATTFAYGFDFARQATFAVQSGKIAKTEDKIGPGLRIGFTWFPGGLDLENLSGLNHWLNPFAVFDPKAPTENFIVGTAMTRRGGLSVAIGASVHKVTVLNGVSEGAPFTGQGDIPTRKVWDRRGVGLFVGVTLDSNAFKTLQEFVRK